MKRLLLLLLALLCAGCACPTKPDDPVRVGFLLTSLEKERYHKDRAFFTREAEKLGVQVRFESSRGDASVQIEQARQVLSEGVRCLVLHAVDRQAAQKVVEMAHQAKVPVVGYDRSLPGIPFDWAVIHDSQAVGRAQAEFVVRALGPSGGEVAVLKGTEGNPVAEAITGANLEVLKAAPGVRVVEVVPHAHWVAEEAHTSTRGLLKQHANLKALLANNSSLARGGIQALREIGRMDVLKEIEPLARGAAQVAVALARGQEPVLRVPQHRIDREGPVPTAVLPVRPFDRRTLEEVVVGSGFHPREAVFPNASPTQGSYPED
jgi:D-xylose transport system substrate-binding protein